MRLGIRGLVCLLAGLSGCDDGGFVPEGDGVTLGGASAVTVACDQFCDASFAAGCPPVLDGCSASCQSLFRGTCEQKLADYLDCIPEGLSAICTVSPSSDPEDPCRVIGRELELCFDCGDGEASLVADRGCTGSYVCGLETACDDDGICSCYRGEELVGTCTAAVAGTQACTPYLSCCMALL